jgi:hypothetical protein
MLRYGVLFLIIAVIASALGMFGLEGVRLRRLASSSSYLLSWSWSR